MTKFVIYFLDCIEIRVFSTIVSRNSIFFSHDRLMKLMINCRNLRSFGPSFHDFFRRPFEEIRYSSRGWQNSRFFFFFFLGFLVEVRDIFQRQVGKIRYVIPRTFHAIRYVFLRFFKKKFAMSQNSFFFSIFRFIKFTTFISKSFNEIRDFIAINSQNSRLSAIISRYFKTVFDEIRVFSSDRLTKFRFFSATICQSSWYSSLINW